MIWILFKDSKSTCSLILAGHGLAIYGIGGVCVGKSVSYAIRRALSNESEMLTKLHLTQRLIGVTTMNI